MNFTARQKKNTTVQHQQVDNGPTTKMHITRLTCFNVKLERVELGVFSTERWNYLAMVSKSQRCHYSDAIPVISMQSLDQQESWKCQDMSFILFTMFCTNIREWPTKLWDTIQMAIDTNMNMLSAKACYLRHSWSNQYALSMGAVLGQKKLRCGPDLVPFSQRSVYARLVCQQLLDPSTKYIHATHSIQSQHFFL